MLPVSGWCLPADEDNGGLHEKARPLCLRCERARRAPASRLSLGAIGERRSLGGVPQSASRPGTPRPGAQAHRDRRVQRAAHRSRRGLPVRAPAALLGAQAEKRRQPPQEAPAGGMPRRCKTHLSGPDETGGCTRLLAMGEALASGGYESRRLPGTRSRSAPQLPRLPHRTPQEGADNQRH